MNEFSECDYHTDASVVWLLRKIFQQLFFPADSDRNEIRDFRLVSQIQKLIIISSTSPKSGSEFCEGKSGYQDNSFGFFNGAYSTIDINYVQYTI